MKMAEAVVQALVRVGEQPATRETGGFEIRSCGSGAVLVHWRPPPGHGGSDAGLAFLEEYARLLRDAGICALLTTDHADPRVLCSPTPALSRNDRPRDQTRRAG